MPTPPFENESNRRSNRRRGLRCTAALVLPGREPQRATTAEVSIEGLSFHFGRPVAPGTRCQISFELPLSERSVPVSAQIKTIYSSYCGDEGFRIGAVFVTLDTACADALLAFTAPEA